VQSLPEERLWPMSMPCILGPDATIRIADYGTSNSGQMKMHYRRGLSHRYGRHMQCIAGLHYNFSLPISFWEMWHEKFDPCHHTLQDCINANYMRLTRNYLKHAWLVFMIMGASPACDRSFFVKAPPDFLTLLPPRTLYGPEACSLRMSRLGYQSHVQDSIHTSYNSLEQYLLDLQYATATPSPEYQKITELYGDSAQLNANLIQIEAELYAPIRPKQVARLCERPIRALQARGIEYIEVRGIDINPLAPLGITASQIYFLDTFLLFCLLHNSPTFSLDNAMQWHSNQSMAVLHGLSKECILASGSCPISADDWADRLFEDLTLVATLLDHDHPNKVHHQAVQEAKNSFNLRSTLPAAMQLDSIKQGIGFAEYGQALSEAHHQTFMAYQLPAEVQLHYEQLAEESLREQERMEKDQKFTYEEYVKRYFS
jgi:glutamate--cysteine ligase